MVVQDNGGPGCSSKTSNVSINLINLQTTAVPRRNGVGNERNYITVKRTTLANFQLLSRRGRVHQAGPTYLVLARAGN
jgi:hypothetical protein